MLKLSALAAIVIALSSCGTSSIPNAPGDYASPQATVAATPSPLASAPEANIQCGVYDLSTLNLSALPDFESLTPVTMIMISDFNAPNEDASIPFPSFSTAVTALLSGAWGLSCSAGLLVPSTGNYTFTENSDDAIGVYVDGETATIDNSTHGYRSASGILTLTAGVHNFRLDYFQNAQGGQGLELFWQLPSTNSSEFLDSTNFVEN